MKTKIIIAVVLSSVISGYFTHWKTERDWRQVLLKYHELSESRQKLYGKLSKNKDAYITSLEKLVCLNDPTMTICKP